MYSLLTQQYITNIHSHIIIKIANCKHAKESWDILQVTHEGTSTVRILKLQMLTTKFENIKVHENQTFSSFYCKLSDIVNSSFNLGEPIPNSKVENIEIPSKEI